MGTKEKRYEDIAVSALRQAAKEEKERKSQADLLYQREITSDREDIIDIFAKKVQQETEALRKRSIHSLSAVENQAKQALYSKRNQMTNELFDTVAQRLKEYGLTQEYQADALTEILALAQNYSPQEITITLSQSLRPLLPKIANSLPDSRCVVSKEIALGGWTLEALEKREFWDSTLDQRLEKSKHWFYQNSSLEFTFRKGEIHEE